MVRGKSEDFHRDLRAVALEEQSQGEPPPKKRRWYSWANAIIWTTLLLVVVGDPVVGLMLLAFILYFWAQMS